MANYHMLDYIHENPDAVQRTLTNNEAAVQEIVERVRADGINRVVVAGIGSSSTAASMAEPAFHQYCSLPTLVLPSTEVGHYADQWIDEKTLFVSVSRSGERSWVVDPLKDARKRGALGVSICGSADSLMMQAAEIKLLTGEGPEITYPKTKSVSACAAMLIRLALGLADPGDEKAAELVESLKTLPDLIKRSIESYEDGIAKLAAEVKDYNPILVCGTGSNLGVALEAAVKIQETNNIVTRGEDTGNLLHGPVVSLGESWMLMAMITGYDLVLTQDLFKLASEFGARCVAVAEPGMGLGEHVSDAFSVAEAVDPTLAALIYLPSIQLLTYYIAIAKGLNPDVTSGMEACLNLILPPGREEPDSTIK